MAGVHGYRVFNVQLTRKTEISPLLLSLVFSGPEVAQMKSDSPDQRIKILFPSEDGMPPSCRETCSGIRRCIAWKKPGDRWFVPTLCATSTRQARK